MAYHKTAIMETLLNPERLKSNKFWYCGMVLISLRDMQIYLAERLAGIGLTIGYFRTLLHDPEPAKEALLNGAYFLRHSAKEADEISLPMTAKSARKLADEIESNPDKAPDEFFKKVEDFHTRFDDEIEGVKLFLVKPDRLFYYENSTLAGEDFKSKFPRSNAELIEAGNCFALARYTACVCHTMRAVEYVLKALEKALNIVPPANAYEAGTWGKILERIADKKGRSQINIPNSKPAPAIPKSPEWATNSDFFDKCFAFIQAVKIPYRDNTFHVEVSYDEAGSKQVFDACVILFTHAATQLKEV